MAYGDDAIRHGPEHDALYKARGTHMGYPEPHGKFATGGLIKGPAEMPDTVLIDEITIHAEKLLAAIPAWQEVDKLHTAHTSARLAKSLLEMTTREEFKFTTFKSDDDNMVTLAPIPFKTLCAHHILPFRGVAFISYVPNGKIVGLSKLPRTVKYWSKGFWVQEDLTTRIADDLVEKLAPKGVGVVMKAEHLCISMRGAEVDNVDTITSAMRGVYADHTRTAKSEFMSFIGRHL
jgi:GTP cyclohydrolase IA